MRKVLVTYPKKKDGYIMTRLKVEDDQYVIMTMDFELEGDDIPPEARHYLDIAKGLGAILDIYDDADRSRR